jgi:hypothetical protein
MNKGKACSNVVAIEGLRRTLQFKRIQCSVNRKGTEVLALSTLTPPFAAESVSGVSDVEMALCKHRSLAFRRRAFSLVSLIKSTDPCGDLNEFTCCTCYKANSVSLAL